MEILSYLFIVMDKQDVMMPTRDLIKVVLAHQMSLDVEFREGLLFLITQMDNLVDMMLGLVLTRARFKEICQ